MSRAILAVAIAAGVGVAVVAVILGAGALASGLPSRPVSSVPALLSEPAGVPGAGLTLAADGLGAVAFGVDEATAVDALTELLGTPVEDGPQPCESESDLVRYVRWGNLTIALPDGSFTGYVIGVYFPPDSPELQVSTEEGLVAGASVAELVASYGDRVAWTTLEETGFADPIEGFGIDGYLLDAPETTGIGGFVEGGREDGRVVTIIAGQPCGP